MTSEMTSSIKVSPATATVAAGATQKFSAMPVGAPENARVSWTVEPATGAGSVDSMGVYTAPAKKGTAKVVATSQAHPDVQGFASVTIS
jgi:hypothetical protein